MLADSATSSAGSERSSVSRSPRAVSPSSPTGWSRLDTGRAARRISMTSSTGRSTIAAISSSVGSRPSWTASSRSTRLILRWRWPMCTGRRIVRAEFSRPRWIDCRIHSVAYVENLKPFRQSNFSEARIRPSMPSWIRSPRVRPWPWYLRATEITNRRLELIIRSLAIMSPRSMRLASWISSAAVSSGYFRASLKNSCRLSVVGSGVSWSFAALAAREALRVFVLELPRWVLGFVGVAVVIVRSLSKLYPKWVFLCNPLTVDKFWSVSGFRALRGSCSSARGPYLSGTQSRVVPTYYARVAGPCLQRPRTPGRHGLRDGAAKPAVRAHYAPERPLGGLQSYRFTGLDTTLCDGSHFVGGFAGDARPACSRPAPFSGNHMTTS